VKKQC